MRDFGVTGAVAPQVPELIVPLLAAITFLGGPTFIAAGSTLGSLLGISRGWVDRRFGLRFLAIVALTLATSLALKNGFALPRPPESLHRVAEDGFGFPSGHATATAGAAFALAALLDIGRSRIRYLVATAAFSVIAATRVLLGVHYVGDVLAGGLVGGLMVWVGIVLTRRSIGVVFGLAAGLAGIGLLLHPG